MPHRLLLSYAAEIGVGAVGVVGFILAQLVDPTTGAYDVLLKGGVLAALVGILMWQQWKRETEIREAAERRENRLQDRVEKLESAVGSEFRALVEEQIHAARNSSASVQRLADALSEWREKSPCLMTQPPSQLIQEIKKAVQGNRTEHGKSPDATEK